MPAMIDCSPLSTKQIHHPFSNRSKPLHCHNGQERFFHLDMSPYVHSRSGWTQTYNDQSVCPTRIPVPWSGKFQTYMTCVSASFHYWIVQTFVRAHGHVTIILQQSQIFINSSISFGKHSQKFTSLCPIGHSISQQIVQNIILNIIQFRSLNIVERNSFGTMGPSFVQWAKHHRMPFMGIFSIRVSVCRLHPIHAKVINGFYAPLYKSIHLQFPRGPRILNFGRHLCWTESDFGIGLKSRRGGIEVPLQKIDDHGNQESGLLNHSHMGGPG